MPKSPKSKLPGVSHARISVEYGRDDNQYGHAYITLQQEYLPDPSQRKETVVSLSFQAHRMDYDTFSANHAPYISESNMPYPLFDYGTTPYSNFYAGHFDTRELKAEAYAGGDQMRRMGKLMDKVAKVFEERNLRSVTSCEVGQWKLALEALNVQVEVVRWYGRSKLGEGHAQDMKFGLTTEWLKARLVEKAAQELEEEEKARTMYAAQEKEDAALEARVAAVHAEDDTAAYFAEE